MFSGRPKYLGLSVIYHIKSISGLQLFHPELECLISDACMSFSLWIGQADLSLFFPSLPFLLYLGWRKLQRGVQDRELRTPCQATKATMESTDMWPWTAPHACGPSSEI